MLLSNSRQNPRRVLAKNPTRYNFACYENGHVTEHDHIENTQPKR